MDPPAAKCEKTRKNSYFLQKKTFFVGAECVPELLWDTLGGFWTKSLVPSGNSLGFDEDCFLQVRVLLN